MKRNALAGHNFDSWAAMEAHLARWTREVADQRRHGTIEEAPRTRFDRDEAAALRPLNGRPPFQQVRELVRVVGSECSIELDTNSYSVPWRLIGQRVRCRRQWRARGDPARQARRLPPMPKSPAAGSG